MAISTLTFGYFWLKRVDRVLDRRELGVAAECLETQGGRRVVHVRIAGSGERQAGREQ